VGTGVAWRGQPRGEFLAERIDAVGIEQRRGDVGGRPIPSTKRRQGSWISATGWYSQTTNDLGCFDEALSVRRAVTRVPAVPRTVRTHQKTPFSR